MRFTISLSNSVSPVVEKDGIINSSRVACSSCIPARLSSSSRQATVVSRSREVRSKSNKKEHETVFLSDGKMLTIVSTRARCSCSMLRMPVLVFVCNDGRLHILGWAGLKTDTFDTLHPLLVGYYYVTCNECEMIAKSNSCPYPISS